MCHCLEPRCGVIQQGIQTVFSRLGTACVNARYHSGSPCLPFYQAALVEVRRPARRHRHSAGDDHFCSKSVTYTDTDTVGASAARNHGPASKRQQRRGI